MALVDDREIIFWEIVEEAEGAHAGLTPVEVAAVVLDAGAVAHLAYHLYVVGGALVEAPGLKLACLLAEKLHLVAEIHLHLGQRRRLSLARGDE